MAKRLLLFTNDSESVKRLLAIFQKINYEVMVSRSELTDLLKQEKDFIDILDLIVVHQNLAELEKVIQLSEINKFKKPVLSISESGDKSGNYFVSYPVIEAEISDYTQAITDNQFSDLLFMNSMSTQAKNKHIVEVIKGKLIVDGIPILLSHREFQLFGLLVENKEAFLDNQTIFRTIWQEDWQLDKQPYLGNLVMKIKNKILIETGAEEPFIINKKSIGYRINDAFLIRERR